ncbi:hypothetical protein QFZ43_003879 [Streptomyces afghaniensis]|nr:hypothetical protein [Streptomyces afghaniensis]
MFGAPRPAPLPHRPLDASCRVRRWYENELGWPTVPGDPLRLAVGVRYDVLDVPSEAGHAALRRLAPGSPVAVLGDRMRFLVAPGTAEELPGLLEWLEWGTLPLGLTAIGAGDTMEAPRPPGTDTPPRARERGERLSRGAGDGSLPHGADVWCCCGTSGSVSGEGGRSVSGAGDGPLPDEAGGALPCRGDTSCFRGAGGALPRESDSLSLRDADGSRRRETGGPLPCCRDVPCFRSAGGALPCARRASALRGVGGSMPCEKGGVLIPEEFTASGPEWALQGFAPSASEADGALSPEPGFCRGRPLPLGRFGSQGAAVWLRPPEPGCEVEASLPTLSALGGGGDAPDLVRLVNTVATQCHRIRLRRARAQPSALRARGR